MPPPKPPLTAISEPDPIYPLSTLLVLGFLFGNDRANLCLKGSFVLSAEKRPKITISTLCSL
jgi:hypothetical protein